MSFLNPQALYFLLPPLLIFFTLLLTQKESQEHFFSQDVMNKLRVSANTLTLKARNALFLMVGFFIIIALAQPVIKDGTIEIKAKSADIMIALDISDSMLAEDVYPNRLELAKQKALLLLDSAPNERIGIVAFAKNSYLVSPLSFDHSAVSFLLAQLDTTSITQKGTDYLGILDVISKVKDKSTKKYLLILTDGGDKSDFSKEIEYAKEKNIVVFILGLGTTKGAPIKRKDGTFIKHNGDIIITKLNENISDLATKSGGVYIQNSTSSSDIEAMLSEIATLSEEKELKSEEVQRYIPLFYYPVGMALLLLLIATSSMGLKARANALPLFLLFGLLVTPPDAEAGVLDFLDLKDAKEAYQAKDYEKSAKAYSSHAKSSKNGQSFYNAGNSYYKQENYEEALKSYESAVFDDKNQRAKNLSNIGNTQVKLSKPESLQKAVEAYEKSLEIKEDKETRENLEAVKKALEKHKQEQEKQDKEDNDKKDKDKKDDKNSDKNEESKESEEDGKKSDEEKSSDEKKDSSKSEKSEDKNQKNDDMKSKDEKEQSKSQENNESKPQDEKDDLKKLDEQEKKDNNSTSASQQSQASSVKQMSDAEADKWLKQLNQEKNTYLYRLDEQKPREENPNEKPW